MQFGRTSTAILLILAPAACNVAPVNDAHGSMIVQPMGTEQSPETARVAILRGLARKGWVLLAEEPGSITARVDVGAHWAIVRVNYTAFNYTIDHVDSSPSLLFDGETIHRRYNHWIDRLRAAIAAEGAYMHQAPPPPMSASIPPPAPPPMSDPPPEDGSEAP